MLIISLIVKNFVVVGFGLSFGFVVPGGEIGTSCMLGH